MDSNQPLKVVTKKFDLLSMSGGSLESSHKLDQPKPTSSRSQTSKQLPPLSNEQQQQQQQQQQNININPPTTSNKSKLVDLIKTKVNETSNIITGGNKKQLPPIPSNNSVNSNNSSSNSKYGGDLFGDLDDDDYESFTPKKSTKNSIKPSTSKSNNNNNNQNNNVNNKISTPPIISSTSSSSKSTPPPSTLNMNNNMMVGNDKLSSSNNNNNNSKSFSPLTNSTSNKEEKDKYDGCFREINFSCDEEILMEDGEAGTPTTYFDDDFDDFIQIEEKHFNPICTQSYIPFYQTSEMSRNEAKKWLEERWFLPSNKKDIIWGEQNRFYYPVYVFNVETSTDFRASFTLNETIESISHTLPDVHREIIVCASNSIDSKLVDHLIQSNGFSHRTPYFLPEEMESFNGGVNIQEKILSIDISKNEIWHDKVLLYLEEKERILCKRYVRSKYNVKTINLDMDTPRIVKESYSIVYLPITSATYLYGDSYYDTLTSGNKGKTVGTSPIGTGMVGEVIMGVVSQMTNLVNDSIGM